MSDDADQPPNNKRFQRPRDTIGFRPSAKLRERIEQEAARAGHSLSAEVSLRVEQAYSDRDWARRSLAAAFRDYETQGVLFLLAQAAAAVSDRRRAHWLADEETWRQTIDAFTRILNRVAPEGTAAWKPSQAPREAWAEYTKSDEYKQAGRLVAAKLLSAVEQAVEVWWPFGDPSATHSRELQRDIVQRKELLHALQALLESRKGKPKS